MDRLSSELPLGRETSMKRATRLIRGLGVAGLLISVGMAAGQEQPKKPIIHTVKKEPVKDVVKLKGVFEATEMCEISLQPLEWTDLTVLEAVPHGSNVKKGTVLLKLNTEKIDESIRKLEMDRQIGDLAYHQAEHELKIQEQTTALDLEAARRAKQIVDEDLKRFVEIDRPLSEKSARFSTKSAENALEYQKEELRQLEEMYKADDLTEETEEIILKRQRDTVERSAFSLEQAENRQEQTLQLTLPRREVTLQEAARRQEIAVDKTAVIAPLSLQKARLELDKLRYNQTKTRERLTRLQRDRKAMVVEAPCDGVVYYGRCVRGNWSSIATMESKLRRGGKITANEVFLTVVQSRPLFVRGSVAEKDIGKLRHGLAGTVQPTGFSQLKLTGQLDSVSAVPMASGVFDARVSVKVDQAASRIMPGMTCGVRLVAYENSEALTLPTSAVFADPSDEEKHFVYVVADDSQHEKRLVTGRNVGDKFEVLSGLKSGDKVLGAKPEDDQ